jgi:hypothetical protein
MGHRGAYGQQLADVFQLERAPSFVTRCLQKSKIAVTEIRCDTADHGLTAPIPREDAFLVTLQLRDCSRHDLFIDDRAIRAGYLRAGAVSIYDLRTNPIANSVSPFHSLHFYIPRPALDLIADMEGCGRVDEFRNDPGLGTVDPCLGELGATLLQTFRRPEEASQIFVDHITIAAAAHALKTYGTNRRATEPASAVLAPSQERRAKEILSSRLDGEILVSDLANECGRLSACSCVRSVNRRHDPASLAAATARRSGKDNTAPKPADVIARNSPDVRICQRVASCSHAQEAN